MNETYAVDAGNWSGWEQERAALLPVLREYGINSGPVETAHEAWRSLTRSQVLKAARELARQYLRPDVEPGHYSLAYDGEYLAAVSSVPAVRTLLERVYQAAALGPIWHEIAPEHASGPWSAGWRA